MPSIYVDLLLKCSVTDGLEGTLLIKYINGENMVTSKSEMCISQRKVTNPAFRRSMPVKLFGRITQEMFVVMEDMGETIDVQNLMQRYTLEAIGKAGFGRILFFHRELSITIY